MDQTTENTNVIEAAGFVIQPRLPFERLMDKMIYQHFIEQANYKQANCERGQLIVAMSSLSRDTGWSYKAIRNSLARLKELGYIETSARQRKKGLVVTILHYDQIQDLKTYKEQKDHEKGKQIEKTGKQTKNKGKQTDFEGKQKDKELDGSNLRESKVSKVYKLIKDKEKGKQITNKGTQIKKTGKQTKNKGNALTSLNSISNSNITSIKDYRAQCEREFQQVKSYDEMQSFVSQLTLIDEFHSGLNQKLLVKYFETLRFTRSTCKVSTNVLINVAEKITKYPKDVVTFSLYKHILDHEDKNEKYTLGIMRNTDVHEARRSLMKIRNRRSEEVKHERIQDNSGHEQYEYGF